MINVRRYGAPLRPIHNFARQNDSLLLTGPSVADLAPVENMSVSRVAAFNTLRVKIQLSMAIGAHGQHTQTARSRAVLENDIEPGHAPTHSKLNFVKTSFKNRETISFPYFLKSIAKPGNRK